MSIKVGCFALVNPFNTLDKQLDQIRSWGFEYADITDNTDGACLGADFGFTAVASLDANPFDIKRMFEDRGIFITSVCAHSNLLDPSAPWRYGTAQLIKAVRLAAAIGVKHVITTEGEPVTDFGKNMTDDQAIFTVLEKLYEPLRLATDYGVKILLENHGHLTDSMVHLDRIIDGCDSEALALNLDTGNLWLGGGDPVAYVHKFGKKVEHVHWKDMPEEYVARRGTVFGCGMATIPLGSGVIDIKGVFGALQEVGFDGYTTLEVAGEDNVLQSYEYLKTLGAE